MIKKILVLSFVGMLVGCGGENSTGTRADQAKTEQEQILELEKTGGIPTLERGDTLIGIDSNLNGVRDDIEAILARDSSSDAQLAALLQTARALQSSLTVDKTDIAAVKAVDREISKGLNCIFSVFDGTNGTKHPMRIAQELESITTNTKPRLKAYLQYNKALDGTSSASPEGDTCE